MIKLILIMFLSLPAFAQQFAGSSKYPSLSISGGDIRLQVGAELQPSTYSQLYTAEAAAMNLSVMCNCAVTIKIPDRVVRVKWLDNPQYKAPDQKCKVKLTWEAPKFRENCEKLTVNEIKNYRIDIEKNGKNMDNINLTNSSMSHTFANLDTQAEYSFWITTIDLLGQKSERVGFSEDGLPAVGL